MFECPKCSYRAKVSGGADGGLLFSIQTILCRDCKALYDAVVRLKIPKEAGRPRLFGLQRAGMRMPKRAPMTPPDFDSAVNRLPYTGVQQFKWISFKIHCPVLITHRVQSWNEPGRCPKCDMHLERNAVPFRIWE